MTVAWLVGLASVAGFAVAGRLAEPVVPGVSIVAVASRPATSTPPAASAAQHADRPVPFRLGPINRPTLGDDGLLGGLVFSGG